MGESALAAPRLPFDAGPLPAKAVLELAIASSLGALFRLPFLDVPLDADAGVFTSVGWLMSRGALLYRDLFDNKPPGIFCLFALVFRVTDASLRDVNLVAAAGAVAGTFFLSLLTRRLFGRGAAMATALLAGFYSASPVLNGMLPMSEGFMAASSSLAMLCLVQAILRQSRTGYVLAGVFFGVAFLFKQVAALDMLAAVAVDMLRPRPPGRAGWRRLEGSIACGAGFAGVAALVALACWRKGILAGMVYDGLTFNASLIAGRYARPDLAVATLRDNAGTIGTHTTVLWAGTLGYIGAWAVRRGGASTLARHPLAALAPAWFVLAASGVALAGRLTPHYLLAAVPALCLMTGAVLPVLEGMRPRARLLARGAAAILVAHDLSAHAAWYVKPPDQVFADMFGDAPGPEARDLGEYLRAHSRPDAFVYNWSKEPEIYFYARRRPVGRYLWASPALLYIGTIPGLVSEIEDSLRAHPPDWVVVDTRIQANTAERRHLILDVLDDGFVVERSFPVVRNGIVVRHLLLLRRV